MRSLEGKHALNLSEGATGAFASDVMRRKISQAMSSAFHVCRYMFHDPGLPPLGKKVTKLAYLM